MKTLRQILFAATGTDDYDGRFFVPDSQRHHPIRVYGGTLHGRRTVRRDLKGYRVALVAGEFAMVPNEWPAGTEIAEIARLRILGRPVELYYGNAQSLPVRVAP